MFVTRRSHGVISVIAHRGAARAAPENTVAAFRRAAASPRADELPAAVPSLEAGLDACAGMAVNIEIKNDPDEPGFEPDRALADDVAAVVASRGDSDRVLVSSFDRASIDRLREVAAPPIATAWLVTVPPPDAV